MLLKLKTNFYKLILKVNRVRYGKNLSIIGIPVIFKQEKAQLQIGDNCTIKSGFLSNLVGLYQRTIIVARETGKIIIGNNVGMSGATIYARDKITIGDYTNIGGNVKILDNDFHPLDPEARKIDDKALIKKKEIVIGSNVFIGVNSIILKGTKLGDNCVVGAGSVVSGVFPANVIVAGNPAKVIRNL